MNKHYTDVELIAKYLELKATVVHMESMLENGFDKERIAEIEALNFDSSKLKVLMRLIQPFIIGAKVYKNGMTTIENEFLRRLDERGADNTKTDAGTAYKSTLTNFKVIDRDAFLKFCEEYWDKGGSDMLNVSAVKDPVKQFMNGAKEPPPGIEMSQFIRVNIRRT